jgi:quercetin dioxygenase-like cupin family protein
MDNLQTFARNAETERLDIASVEGLTMQGVWIKLLLQGKHALLIEAHLKKGTITPEHTHDHESYCYVLSGRVRARVGQETMELGPGDAFFHPIGVPHVNEALEDTVWLEIKSPPVPTW